jgi:hypothetical protein
MNPLYAFGSKNNFLSFYSEATNISQRVEVRAKIDCTFKSRYHPAFEAFGNFCKYN